MLDSGEFPKSWGIGHIFPLHKKGDINNVDNYRGITLLSCMGKTFTRIINSRLSNWAEYYNIYHAGQAGFRKGHGTADNVFILQSLIERYLFQRRRLYCAFI